MDSQISAHYPMHINYPTAKDPGAYVKVRSAAEHLKVDPEHYARYYAPPVLPSAPISTAILDEAVLKERERCATLAEGMERGNKLGKRIADAIRFVESPAAQQAVQPVEIKPETKSAMSFATPTLPIPPKFDNELTAKQGV